MGADQTLVHEAHKCLSLHNLKNKDSQHAHL